MHLNWSDEISSQSLVDFWCTIIKNNIFLSSLHWRLVTFFDKDRNMSWVIWCHIYFKSHYLHSNRIYLYFYTLIIFTCILIYAPYIFNDLDLDFHRYQYGTLAIFFKVKLITYIFSLKSHINDCLTTKTRLINIFFEGMSFHCFFL